jgi:RNA polymerase sigma-54 factor
MPSGRVVDLAVFFGSGTSARELLSDLIAAEERPRSDAELAEAMRQRGHRIARRTVAKYRSQLAIAAIAHRV